MSDDDETAPGSIGRFQVEAQIGRGGMGVVYRAWDPRLERRVALKALPLKLAADTEHRARLEREARVLAALSDRNVATILDLEEHDGRTFLVLEYVDGESLGERLDRGRLGLAETLRITIQIAGGLAAAHAVSIVHRDLTPNNVMLTSDGTVKVIDFGLAREARTEPLRAGPVTGINVLVGTPGYMSPERVNGASPDARSDVWAFGCLLFECLAGRRAIEGDGQSERLRKTLAADIDWSRLPVETPERLLGLLERCLEADPARRPGSLSELLPDLRTLLARAEGCGVTRPMGTHRSGTPRSLTSFVGRERELRRLDELLAKYRLVTLVGVGGCGKTRLALEAVAQQARDVETRVHFVDLAPLGDERQVASRVAAALGLAGRSSQSPEEQLIDAIGTSPLLLILDNCEHVLTATARMTERLLSDCHELRILATSREGLAISGEYIYALPPLSVPDETVVMRGELFESESVQLFLARARSVRPDFDPQDVDLEALARTCRRLDGLPLALELAAARLRVLSLGQLDERLSDRFRVLSGGRRTALPRQQTLKATLDWSHDLLDEDEQVLLRRLSVFAGAFSLDAVESVCSNGNLDADRMLDLLARLVDKSLVLVVDSDHELRYRLLETVRCYARERLLEADETSELVDRHRRHLITLAERLDGELTGPRRGETLKILAREHDDIGAALDATDSNAPLSTRLETLRLAVALRLFWGMRGHWTIGRQRLAEALRCAGDEAEPRLRAQALTGIGRLALSLGDSDSAHADLNLALSLWRGLEEPRGIASTLNGLSIVARESGRLDEAEAFLDEVVTIAREAGDDWNVAVALLSRGNIREKGGDSRGARIFFEESLVLLRRQGGRSAIAAALLNLGPIAWVAGDVTTARAYLDEGLELAREMEARAMVATGLESLATLDRVAGNDAEAEIAYRESLAIRRELGDRPGIGTVLENLARLALARNQLGEADGLVQEALELLRSPGGQADIASALRVSTQIRLAEGDLTAAGAQLDEASQTARSRGDRIGEAKCEALRARLLLTEGRTGEAREVAERALAPMVEAQHRPQVRRLIGLLAEVALEEGEALVSAKLAAAVERMGEELGAQPAPESEASWQRLGDALCDSLSQEELDEARARGRELCLAEIVQLARRAG